MGGEGSSDRSINYDEDSKAGRSDDESQDCAQDSERLGRAWIHSELRDSSDRLLFESWRLNPSALIEKNINDLDLTRCELQYCEITRGDQAGIYEADLQRRTRAGTDPQQAAELNWP